LGTKKAGFLLNWLQVMEAPAATLAPEKKDLIKLRGRVSTRSKIHETKKGPSNALAARRILWGGMVAAFLCFNGPRTLRLVPTDPLKPISPSQSMDRYLGEGHNWKPYREALSRTSTDCRVLIFVKGDASSSLNALAMSYLAWPRDIEMIFADKVSAAAKLSQVVPQSAGIIAFCDVEPPPWFPIGMLCAPKVRLWYPEEPLTPP
jgi:hypothetical protein